MMVYSPRIGPDGKFAKDWHDLTKRLYSLETRPAGRVVIRETLTTTDPLTGEQTIFGQLPDGSHGFQPFVGDITPPPVASTPLTASQPGLITVAWDGNFVGGADKPRDFEQVNVIGHKIVAGVTTLSQTLGFIRHANGACFINEDAIAEDETWQFSLQSEDFNGNKAANSARSATVTMIGSMSGKAVNDKLAELTQEDLDMAQRVTDTQANLAAAQALADALLAKGANLVPNGDFDVPLVTGKPVVGWPSMSLASVTVAASAARTGSQYLRLTPSGSQAYAYTNEMTSASGRTYRAEYWVKLGQTATVTDATATVGFLFATFQLNGSQTTVTSVDTTVPVSSLSTSTWTKVSRDYTVTQPVRGIKFGPRVMGNGNIYNVDNFKVTDVTDALAAQSKADSAFAIADQAAAAAGTAGTSADNKNKNWYQDAAPAGISHKNGDTWFDTNDDNRIYVWNATAGAQGTGAWIDMRDKAIANASVAASGAQLTANGKNTSYYQDDEPLNVPPGTLKKGDLWIDTGVGEGNRLSTWSGASWQTAQDSALALIEAAKKGRTFTQNTAPAVEFQNETTIWNDTSNPPGMIVKYWNPALLNGAGNWEAVADKGIKKAQDDINAVPLTIMSTTAPTGSAQRPSTLWIDISGGVNLHKRWDAVNGWTNVADTRIASTQVTATAAAVSAQNAWAEAQKNRIFTQDTQPAVEFRNSTTTWNDTSNPPGMITKYWDPTAGAGAGAWVAVADKGIKTAQDAANAKGIIIYSDNTPAASAQLPQNLWIDTTGGININKRWLGGGWSIVADSRIASSAVAVTAADTKAQTALEESKKNRTFTGGVQPALEFRNVNTTWIDTSAGPGLGVIRKWDTTLNAGAGGWAAVKDPAISQAQIDAETNAAADAKIKSDAAYTAAIADQGFLKNPSFDEWPSGTLPYKYGTYGTTTGVVTKETSIVRKGINALRFNVDSATQSGANFNDAYLLGHASNSEFVTVELDFYLVSGTLSGAGVLVDWGGSTGTPRATVKLVDEVPDAVTGKWYRVSRVVQRPTIPAQGTFTSMKGFLMANYTVIGSLAAKDIIFDWIDVRPSTTEEILAYTGPTISYVDARALAASAAAVTDANGKLANKNKSYFQNSKPSTGIAGDIWIDGDDGNKLYIHDGTDYAVAQDSAIDKALYSTFPTDIDVNAADKWLFTKYNKNLASTVAPQYSDIVGFAGTSTLVDSGTDLVKNQGSNYMGQLRTVVNVISAKTVTFTATHDDGGAIYVDGASVYSKGAYTATASVSFALNAGWHVLDFLWNEVSGNDGWFGINPTVRSQVDAMFAPVSLSAVSSMASAAQTSANGKNQVVYSNSDASGTTGPTGQPFIIGDTWFKRSLTSPFNIIGQWEFSKPDANPAAWYARKIDGLTIANIDAGTITVGTLSGQSLSATAINGKTITGATIQTATGATSGIKLTTTELVGYDGNNQKNFRLTTGGTLQIKGEIQSGSTISGATLSASGIYTNPATDRGVKIKDTGIRAWDANGVPTFILDATTGEVEVPGLKADSIKGTMIEASTIGVDKLLVMSMDNLISEPTFLAGGKSWNPTTGMTIDPTGARNSGPAFKIVNSAAVQEKYNLPSAIPVESGQSYRASAYIMSNVAIPAGGFYMTVRTQNPTNAGYNYQTINSTAVATTGAWTLVEGVVTIPSSHSLMALKMGTTASFSTGTLWVDYVSLTRMSGGSLIVDGAIDGKTITGATIQSISGAVSGTAARGPKLTADGLKGWDGSATPSFNLDNSGNLTLKGAIKSGSTIEGATLSAAGGGIETTTAVKRGIKITNTGASAWNGVGDLTFRLDAVDGELEVPGLKANSIKGDMIAADTIGVRSLLVTDLANFAPSVADSPLDWERTGGMLIVTTGLDSSGYRFGVSDNAATAWARGPYMSVAPGDSLYATATSYRAAGATGGFYLRYEWFDKNKVILAGANAYSGSPQSSASPDDTKYELVAVAPTGAVYARFTLAITAGTGPNGFHSLMGRRMNNGKLIVDGAIDGKVITGATVQSSDVANTGVKFDSTGIRGYDGTPNPTFNLEADGDLTLTGTIKSGSVIEGAKISATGGGLETSTSTSTGVKINNTGIKAYGGGNLKFHLDATTGLLEVPGIKTNSLTGDLLQVGTIGADKMAISDFRNLATINERTGKVVTDFGGTKITAGFNEMVTPSGLYLFFTDQRGPVPFEAGDELYFEFIAKATTATTCNFSVYTYDAANANVLVTKSINIAATATTVTGNIVVTSYKANATSFVLGLTSVANKGIQVQNVKVYRKNGGELIVDGSIRTNHMLADTIDATVLKAGTMSGDKLEAGSITAEKLTVGIGTNLIPDPGFVNTAVTALRKTNTTNATDVKTNSTTDTLDWTTATTANSYFRPTGVNQSITDFRKWIPVTPGEKYIFSADITLATGQTGDLRLTGRVKDGSVTSTAFNLVPTDPADPTVLNVFPTLAAGQNVKSYLAEVPAGCYWMLPEIRIGGTVGTATIVPNSLQLRRRATGELIVDGSITTNKIGAGAVDASKISAGSITASAVGSKAITTDKLIVSSSNNLIIEPDFGLSGISWTTGTYITVNSTAGRGATPALRFTGTTALQTSYNLMAKSPDVTNKIVIDDDHRYRASLWVKSNVALPANAVRISHRRYTTATTNTAATIAQNTVPLVANQWTQISGISPALPANTIAVDFYVVVDNVATTDITDIDAVSVTRAADGNLVVDGAITSNSLETDLVLSTNIIAGSKTGTHAAMEPTGFKVYAANPVVGGTPQEIISLGVNNSDDYFSVSKSNGEVVGSITSDGRAAFQQMNIDAYSATASTGGLFYGGYELGKIINDMPRGLVGAALRTTSSATNATVGNNIPFLRLEVPMQRGRIYKVCTSSLNISRTAGSVLVGIKVNATGGTNYATLADGSLTEATVWDENNAPVLQELFALTSGSDRTVSFLIWMGVAGASAAAGFRPSPSVPARLWVEDIGAATHNNTANGTFLDLNVAPAAPKNTYIRTYVSNNSKSYNGVSAAYTTDATRMYQGLSPTAGVGNLKSIATFGNSTDGTAMSTDLSGASINYIRVYFNFAHWSSAAGGTARIGLHPHTTPPATYTLTSGANTGYVSVISTKWPRPGARWIDIPSTEWPKFISGVHKGVYLEGDSTATTYGIADRPTIEISYTK